MEWKQSMETYQPSKWADEAEEDLSLAMGNMRMENQYQFGQGRGRGQQRWGDGAGGGGGGGGRGRGRGWYRDNQTVGEVNNSRHSPPASDPQGSNSDHGNNFDLREKLNRGERYGSQHRRDQQKYREDDRQESNQRRGQDRYRDDDNNHRRDQGRYRDDDRQDTNQRWGQDRYREGERQDNNRRREQERSGKRTQRGSQNNHNKLQRPKKNTENFNPCHEAPPMRLVVAAPGLSKYNQKTTTRDVIIVNDLFGDQKDMTIYNKLLEEIKNSGVPDHQLWKLWHGDSHVIADDKKNWKEKCPTFAYVVDRIRDYFEMDIKATRFNWYRNTSEWKPFHHDAAAMKPDKARTQNFTVGVSFGCERDAAFEHAETKTVIALPQPNGTIYTFGRDVNIIWRHGILQVPPDQQREEGRISIIAWGWIPQTEM